MGNKLKNTIKEIELRSLAVAVFGVAILVVIATYITNNLTPGTSAWNPRPDSTEIIIPTPGINPQPATDIIFSDPIQLTGNPDDPWEEFYGFSETIEYPSDADNDSVVFIQTDPQTGERKNIFVHNTSTDKLIRINTMDINQFYGDVRIWGDTVVYQMGGNIHANKVMEGNSPIIITNDNVTERGHPNMMPDIYGNTVVWVHQYDANYAYNIWMIDINRLGDGPRRVTNPGPDESYPRIDGNVIIWKDWDKYDYPEHGWECNNSNPDGRNCGELHMCDLKNDYNPRTLCEIYFPEFEEYRERSLTNDFVPATVFNHDIYGDNIVWSSDAEYDWSWEEDEDRNKYDVFLHNLNDDDDIKMKVMFWEEGLIGGDHKPLVWNSLVSVVKRYLSNPNYRDRSLYDTNNNNKEYDLGAFIYSPFMSSAVISGTEENYPPNSRKPFNLFFVEGPSSSDQDLYLIRAVLN